MTNALGAMHPISVLNVTEAKQGSKAKTFATSMSDPNARTKKLRMAYGPPNLPVRAVITCEKGGGWMAADVKGF